MKNIFFAPVLLITLLFASCDLGHRGSGDILTETRAVSDFHALDICTSGKVEVHRDSVFHVEVSCEENILSYLETEVVDGVLKVYFNRNVWDVDGLHVRVSAPDWDSFELSGSANVMVPDSIGGDELQLKVSGSGMIKVSNADFITSKMNVSGSGDILLNGQGNVLSANVSGSGNVDARNFPVKIATAVVSGSGNIRLNVSESLNASVSGSGNVEYLGNPKVNKDISGSGNIRKL